MVNVRFATLLFLGLSASRAQQPLPIDNETEPLEYLASPDDRWGRSLGLSTPMHGNGVVLTDDDLLYVTSSDGRLSIIHAPSGQLRKSLQPLQGMSIRCQSSVVVGDTFVVYSIQEDTDATESPSSPLNATNPQADEALRSSSFRLVSTSRLVAVNRTTMEFAWISEPLLGEFSGDPVISSDNQHIFFTHNAENAAYFTVAESKGGAIVLNEASTDITFLKNHRYGPVGIAKSVSTTPYFGGEEGNTNDIVIWHSGGGDEDQGETQLFQFPTTTSEDTTTTQLGTRTWTASASPVLTASGSNLYFGTSEGRIRGWEERQFELTPKFNMLVRTGDTPTWLEMRDELFFVSTSESYFYAMNRTSMEVLWELPAQENGTIVADPVISPDGTEVYIARGKAMYSKDALTGKDLWEEPLSTDSGSDIVAGFAVSKQFLYFVGREPNMVTAVRIAQPAGPTIRPSATPTATPTISLAPSRAVPVVVTTSPSIAPAAEPEDTGDTNSRPIMATLLGTLAGIALLAIVIYVGKKWMAGRGDSIDTNYNFHKQGRRGVEEPQIRPQTSSIQKPKRYKYDPSRV